jgi:hypothetical protein
LHIILFLHLLSTNHKCTQPCYFPLLYEPAAQKVKMNWNSSMRSSRLCAAPVDVPVVFESSAVSFHKRVILVFREIIYVINILYPWHLVISEHFWSVCVEQLILGIYMMSTWFCLQNRVWHSWTRGPRLLASHCCSSPPGHLNTWGWGLIPSSDWLRPPTQRKARELLSGSTTSGTVGCRLRPKILDTASFLQRQMVVESYTLYWIWPHHSWLKGRGHQPKRN